MTEGRRLQGQPKTDRVGNLGEKMKSVCVCSKIAFVRAYMGIHEREGK